MFALILEKIIGFFGFPDVCNTPTPAGTTPIPYLNIGQSQNADSGTCAEKVYFCDMQAFIMKTKVTQTMGNEAGTNGGIV
jgi:hypothetical protein